MVQGVTEVVPVSSSAHLALLPWLLRWPAAADRTTLAAGLHAGSCLGVAAALGRPSGRNLVLAAATSLPAAAAGLLAADVVEESLGRPDQVAVLLAAAGAALALADRRPGDRPVTGPAAGLAALAQVAALAPGVSRSGAALTALRAARVPRDEAVRFSLLMSLPVTAGAAALTLWQADARRLWALAVPLGVGVPAAGVAGFTAARLQFRHGSPSLTVFTLYRLGLAAVVLSTSRRRRGHP